MGRKGMQARRLNPRSRDEKIRRGLYSGPPGDRAASGLADWGRRPVITRIFFTVLLAPYFLHPYFSVVVLKPQMRNQFLAFQVTQGILQFDELDK
jgi:hypothetical protein